MFKRLMIGLVAVGLAVILTAEAAHAYSVARRRSVGVTVTFGSDTDLTNDGFNFAARVFGLPADDGGRCGEVKGELYCGTGGFEAAIRACNIATGDSAAIVLALDKDTIAPGSLYFYKDSGVPHYFTAEEVNFDVQGFGQRLELRYFASRATLNNPGIISLPIGDGLKTAGIHQIEDPNFLLRDYVGTWDATDGKFLPSDGYGINGENFISKVPVKPLWGTDLDPIVGKTVCAAVHHDQIKGDTLKGNYLGLAAFKVLSRSESFIEVEIMDAFDVCGGLLYNETELVVGSAGECKPVVKDVVWAPAPYTSGGVLDPDTFPEVKGLISCSLNVLNEEYPGAGGKTEAFAYVCKGTAEVVLNTLNGIGQDLCDKLWPDDITYFTDFIPTNRGGGGDYAEWAFTLRVTPDSNLPVSEQERICGDGEVEGVDYTKLSRYGCLDLVRLKTDNSNSLADDIFTCYGCGQAPWGVDGTLP